MVATAASYYPGRMPEHPEFKSTGGFNRPDVSSAIYQKMQRLGFGGNTLDTYTYMRFADRGGPYITAYKSIHGQSMTWPWPWIRELSTLICLA